MEDILKLAEALWNGEIDTSTYHPLGRPRGIAKIDEGMWFHKGFANTIIRETADGLIIVDPSAAWDAKQKHESIRSVTKQRLDTAVFTHGHVDHVFGIPVYEKEAKENAWALPKVIAHSAMPDRFRRYRASETWNGFINLRQFRGGVGEPEFPVHFYYPDITYHDRIDIDVGGITAYLRHSRGETDDHTWVFFPDNKVLCTGDLFIYGIPNAGNPQKVQRYAYEWARALREMAALKPEILAPGHGFPIIGQERVSQALEDTATFLESIHDQTLALMNRGASLDAVLHGVKAPEELMNRPYLRPVYDEPEFIVRNIWRFYGGWYDGMPSHLKPAPEKNQASEIARLAGGSEKVADRALELMKSGQHRLACHLAEWAYLSSPEDQEIRNKTSEVFTARAESESSTMAMGIFLTAAKEMGGKPQEALPGKTVVHAQHNRSKR
jgi:alkyl sulfatase BDS1-like metallo-beta-lactamase superfamily hydrolase